MAFLDYTGLSRFLTKLKEIFATKNVVSTSANGLTPKLSGSSTTYLNGNGFYDTPPDTIVNNVAFAECSTAAATAAKEAAISGNSNWSLVPGAIVGVKFTNSNTASNVTLNINKTGAKQIWYAAAVYTSTSATVCGSANRTIFYMYDGTYWRWISHGSEDNTTYSNATLGQGYGTCETAAGTTALVVTLANYTLSTGGIVSVKFTNAVPANATMNINSKGGKNIFYRGTAITADRIIAGDIATFIYDGAQYHLIGINRNPLGTVKANGYWGVCLPGDDTSGYLRTTTNGIIPNSSDGTNGSGNIGTSSWPFKAIYAKTFYGALSGNATSATSAGKWTNARTIGGISVDGSGNRHWFASCPTEAATAAKVATVEDSQTFTLTKGAMVFVKFTNANSIANPTLNVNSTGAKNIYRYGTTAPSTSAATSWQAGSVVCLIYDGSYWQMVGWLNDNTNTDTKVTETVASDDNEYPILTKNTTATTTVTDTSKFSAGITINPSKNQITATTFKGALTGNANTATKLSSARSLKVKLNSTTAITFDGSANQEEIPVTGTLPIANGGSGGTTALSARNNLGIFRSLGTNITNGKTNDTAAFWAGKEPGLYYFNATGQLNDQPSQYGFMLNIKGSETGALGNHLYTVYSAGTATRAYIRSFNTSGTTPVLTDWTKLVSWEDIYPVGSVYIAYTNTSPASRFGGTWTQITGYVLRAANDVSTGGANTKSITNSYLPTNLGTFGAWGWTGASSKCSGVFSISSSTFGNSAGSGSAAGGMEIKAAGSGTALNVLPAYQDLYVWRRTA